MTAEEIEKCYKRVVLDQQDGGLTSEELDDIFGTKHPYMVVLSYSAGEIAQSIKDYQKRKCFNVGDEVICKYDRGSKFIITKVTENRCYVVGANGTPANLEKDAITKTGKSYPLQTILQSLTF